MFDMRHEVVLLQHRDYLRQAEQYRLSKLVTAHQPGTARRMMAWTGRRLVIIGEALQDRATPPAPVVLCSEPRCA